MSNILLAFGANGTDLQLADGDLMKDGGLLSSIVISLFTDRLAGPDDELPAGDGDRRGWWGDATLPDLASGGGSDRIGSLLWLLRREKQLPSVVARAREYAREALQWLLDEGRATRLEVDADVPAQGVLRITVRVDGQSLELAYDYLTNTYRLTE